MQRTIVLALVASSLVFTGCRWERRHSGGVAIGGIGGAGLGALIGSAAGDWGTGAVIGAGAGAIAGYLIADATGGEEERTRVVYRDRPPSEAEQRRMEAQRYFDLAISTNSRVDSEYYLRKSIELYPMPAAYNNLGILHLQEGDRFKARDMFRKALDLDPAYEPAAENLRRLDSPS